MAAPFKHTTIKSFPRVGEKTTRDSQYWQHLEFPVTRKEHSPITHIEFSPTKPYNFVATCSAKVQVFSQDEFQVQKSFSRFYGKAYSGSYRQDGNLLVAGSEEGSVKVFNLSSKAQLRNFKGHTGPTKVARFLSDNVRVVTGSDDQTVRLWDVASETETHKFEEHKDYIRCAAVSKASKDLFFTGSYDHTVKLFDARTDSSVLTVDHGQPVESILVFPAGGVFISAGGTTIKVWDALGGGRLLASFSNHHKTVTSMCFCSNYERLVSAGLDRMVKIYDVSSYQVVHSIDFPSSVLSVGVAPDDSTVVVGMTDGLLSMQHRKAEKDVAEETRMKRQKWRRKQKASYHFTLPGKTYAPTQTDEVVERERKKYLARYDRYFKKFEHTKALDAALEIHIRTNRPEVTVSVLQELIRRGGIQAALAGREEKSLLIILKFLQKNISNHQFTPTLIDISNILLDLYADQLGALSPAIQGLVQLGDTVQREISYCKELMQLLGTMDTLFAASQTSHDSGPAENIPDLTPSLSSSSNIKTLDNAMETES